MDIQEFITETIKQIALGVSSANKEIEPYETNSAGGGIKVCGMNLGADSSNNNSNQTSSRVQFKLNLVLPPTNSVKYHGQYENA